MVEKEIFIPQNITELYDKMVSEQFTGQLSMEGDWLIWRLPNSIIIKVAFSELYPEAYLAVCFCMDGKKELQCTHWHPQEEDIYGDLSEINSGSIFWVQRKKRGFMVPNVPEIMFKSEWERFSEKRKSKYIILS